MGDGEGGRGETKGDGEGGMGDMNGDGEGGMGETKGDGEGGACVAAVGEGDTNSGVETAVSGSPLANKMGGGELGPMLDVLGGDL